MKKFFASLAVALAAMCFAPTAGATETVALPQEVAVEILQQRLKLSCNKRLRFGSSSMMMVQ